MTRVRKKVFVCSLLLVFLSGCAAVDATATATSDIQASLVRIEKTLNINAGDQTTEAGRDANVNEPWTARILAFGSIITGPIFIGIYILSHRSEMSRDMLYRLKGYNRPNGKGAKFKIVPNGDP